MPELDAILVPAPADFARLREDLRAERDSSFAAQLHARRRAMSTWTHLSHAARSAALHTAFVLWRGRAPWRWFVPALQLRAFVLVGGRFADRWLLAQFGADSSHDGHLTGAP